MKAQKVTVEIKMESLSIDVLRAMLASVIEQVEREAVSGVLSMEDGDFVEWTTTREHVEI